ncbi:MAG: leucine-rich repeat protein [Bacteroidales bacterium]|nr:leucine-rich repeat protein [Bacteroidales bacterium]
MKRLLTHLSCLTRLAMTLVLVLSAMEAGAQEVVGPGNTGYTLTLVPNYEGGQGEMITNVTSYHLPAFTRPNYYFSGWAESSGGDVKYAAGADITLTGNTTLFAKWAEYGVGTEFTVDDMKYAITSINPLEVALIKGKNYEYVTIPASVAFWGHNFSVTSIGEYAFESFSSLRSVTFAEGSQLRSIGDYAFMNCDDLVTVTFAEGSQLRSIGDYAFMYCSSLTSIDLPASVTSIGHLAFGECKNLATVTLHSNPTIGISAFPNNEGLTVTMTLPTNKVDEEEYWTTFYNRNWNFQADANTKVYKATVDGMQLTLHKVEDGIVNRNTAVILKSSVDHLVMTSTKTNSTDTGGNDLKGTYERKLCSDILIDNFLPSSGCTFYVMGKPEGKEMGFYEYTGAYIPGGKAFIILEPSASAPTRGLSFVEEEVTNIESVDSGELTVDNWYTLSGVKLEGEPTERGVYIHNGRKEVVR